MFVIAAAESIVFRPRVCFPPFHKCTTTVIVRWPQIRGRETWNLTRLSTLGEAAATLHFNRITVCFNVTLFIVQSRGIVLQSWDLSISRAVDAAIKEYKRANVLPAVELNDVRHVSTHQCWPDISFMKLDCISAVGTCVLGALGVNRSVRCVNHCYATEKCGHNDECNLYSSNCGLSTEHKYRWVQRQV